MAASGAAVSVDELINAASAQGASLCNTNQPTTVDQYACYDNSVYETKKASYVDDMVNTSTMGTDKVPMPNRNCKNIFSPTNFATNKDGDKSQTAYFIAGLWDQLCSGNNSVMTNDGGKNFCEDFVPTGANDANNLSLIHI